MSDGTDDLGTAMDAFAQLGPIDTSPLSGEPPREEEGGDSEPLDNGNQIPNDAPAEGDEPTADEHQEEPAHPAIDPPTRWTDEQKKLWANVPPDAQQAIAASFKDQERAIGAKSEEAAAARKAHDAVLQSATQLAQNYADQLTQYARALEPQRPDYGLIATDPQAYMHQMAVFEAANAQRQDLAQRAEQARHQANTIQQQQFQDEARQVHTTLTQAWGEKWADPEQRKATIAELTPIASALGYAPDVQSQANATDMLALRTAADWKVKADKWDQLQASKMEGVRAAKQAPRVQTPGVAPQKGAQQRQGFNESMTRLKQSGDVRDAAVAFAKLG